MSGSRVPKFRVPAALVSPAALCLIGGICYYFTLDFASEDELNDNIQKEFPNVGLRACEIMLCCLLNLNVCVYLAPWGARKTNIGRVATQDGGEGGVVGGVLNWVGWFCFSLVGFGSLRFWFASFFLCFRWCFTLRFSWLGFRFACLRSLLSARAMGGGDALVGRSSDGSID